MPPGPATTVVERTDGRYTVLRPARFQRLAVAVLFAVGVAFSVLPDSSGERLPPAIGVPLCGFLLVAAVRQSQLRVELGPTVRIVNLLRTRVLPWNQVTEFGYDGRHAWVELVGRRRHGISAFSAGPRSLPAVDRVCREAVRLMETRRKSRLANRRGGHQRS